jgi:peroxisomal membrane protein 2
MQLLEKHPLLVKAATGAVMNAVGDLIAQLVIDKGEPFQWRRFFTFAALGAVLVAPALHFWYLTLSRVITTGGATGKQGLSCWNASVWL